MFEQIKKVKEQFLWEPEVAGKPHFAKASRGARVISCGMGGSNIASGFLEMLRADLEIIIHRSYGLPTTVSRNDLVIISSYSGNTEEVLDSFEKSVNAGFDVIVVTVGSDDTVGAGGKLLELAKEKNVSYIQIPKTGIEPRMALGYSLLAMLKTVGDEENLKKAQEFGKNFNPENFEKEGRALAEKLTGKTPIIYSSWNNKAIAYAWKIKFNEIAKVPTFFNVFPELNHNEIVGFLSQGATPEGVCGGAINPHFIFLKDSQDHPRIQKRMEITQKMLEEKGFGAEAVDLKRDIFEKIFNSLAVVDHASYALAQNSGFDPEDSSAIEEFKKKMKN